MHLLPVFSQSSMKCNQAFVPLHTIFLDFAHFLSTLQRYSSKIGEGTKHFSN